MRGCVVSCARDLAAVLNVGHDLCSGVALHIDECFDECGCDCAVCALLQSCMPMICVCARCVGVSLFGLMLRDAVVCIIVMPFSCCVAVV